SNELKLIEINTNASFLLMGLSLYEALKIPRPTEFSEADLQKDVLDEMELCFGKRSAPKALAIIDDNPPSQKLYVEFLLYQSLFRSFGWDCEICDFRELQFDEQQNVLTYKAKKLDFIYNRYTDFLLERSESQNLKKAFFSKAACFSPNPTEYKTYADKERLIELGKTGTFPVVLQSEELNSENKDKIWEKRKSLFFKPLRSYGSKQSYKGASISRKAFDEFGEGILAQEYCPADERTFSTPNGEQNFKFDLRFYAYQNRLETVIARLYQGQVTNTRTPFGGFAPVRFV
ncbi:MAG: hypothetical protein AB7O96_01590, partial [Pseudobdellovibrionaceae bacterium]